MRVHLTNYQAGSSPQRVQPPWENGSRKSLRRGHRVPGCLDMSPSWWKRVEEGVQRRTRKYWQYKKLNAASMLHSKLLEGSNHSLNRKGLQMIMFRVDLALGFILQGYPNRMPRLSTFKLNPHLEAWKTQSLGDYLVLWCFDRNIWQEDNRRWYTLELWKTWKKMAFDQKSQIYANPTG